MVEYIGKSVNPKHVEQARTLLDVGENLEGIFHCGIVRSHGGRGVSLHDYLIISNKRLVVWGRGIFSKDVETFDYDKIANVQGHQGILLGDIEINVFGAKERFTSMVKTDVPIAVKMITEHMTKTKTSSNTGYNELEKLAELKEKGIITQKEFEMKKKKILGI